VVVDVGLATVLFLRILVRDVHVLDGGMAVVVSVCGQQVTPILTAMVVVGDVVVLVAVLDRVVPVVPARLRHPDLPIRAASHRTYTLSRE
jgi:hypothetical protein